MFSPLPICLVSLPFFNPHLSRCLIDSANIKIIIRTAKGDGAILHKCLTRGIADENFWCVQKKNFLDDEENPNRFVAVIADKLCQGAITVITNHR